MASAIDFERFKALVGHTETIKFDRLGMYNQQYFQSILVQSAIFSSNNILLNLIFKINCKIHRSNLACT